MPDRSTLLKYSTDTEETTFKIFVAGNNLIVLDQIKQLFPGYTVRIADSAFKAVTAIVKESFDVFIIDFDMETLNGIELLRLAAGENKGKKYLTILCTAGQASRFNYAIKQGLISYLIEKPIDLKTLKEVVQRGTSQLRKRTGVNHG